MGIYIKGVFQISLRDQGLHHSTLAFSLWRAQESVPILSLIPGEPLSSVHIRCEKKLGSGISEEMQQQQPEKTQHQ